MPGKLMMHLSNLRKLLRSSRIQLFVVVATLLGLLTVLTNLRKICNHPSLYTPTPTDGGDEAAAARRS